jgi:hypothetical protein
MKNKLIKLVTLMSFVIVFSTLAAAQNDESPPIPPGVRVPQSPNEQPLAKGLEVLKQANLAHGGKTLDNLKTLRIKEKLRVDDLFYEVRTIVDFNSKKIREESRSLFENSNQANKYLYIKQFESNKGWIFAANEKREITDYQQKELNRFLSLGVIGLRSVNLKNIVLNSVQIDPATRLKTLRFTVNGEYYVWVFNWKNQLISESNNASYDKNDKKQEYFDDFRLIGGIRFPYRSANMFRGEFSSESLMITRQILTVEVNPKLTEKNWSVPKSENKPIG